MNVMTRIEGHPHDDLLTRKGYRGHPTLAFMDAKGNVLARPLDRSVESFEETLVAIGEYEALKQRATEGAKGLEYSFFVLEHKLGKLRGEPLAAAGKALKDLDEAQQRVVDDIVLGVEVDDLVLQSLGDAQAVKRAGERMLEILDSGRCPSMESSANAWSVLARYGEQVENADLLDRCAAGLRKHYADDKGMTNWATSLEKKAAAFRAKRGE